MPIEKTQGLILVRRDFRETSLILEFYTQEFGKISGLLKGARTDPLKFASNFEPFSLNEIIFYRKRVSSLHLVSQLDKIDDFTPIRQSVEKTSQAIFMLDLLASVMQEEEKNSEVFTLTLNCLKELETNYRPDRITTIFKIKMLDLSGFKPHFDSCVLCSDKILGHSNFSLNFGGLLCQKCCHKDPAARSVFRGTIATILHIEKNDFTSALNLGMNPQIKKELNAILNAFLNFHLNKELKSQKVIQKLAVGV